MIRLLKAWTRIALGVAKAASGRYEAATADHDEAIRLQPDFSGAYNNRGNAKQALGRYDYDEASPPSPIMTRRSACNRTFPRPTTTGASPRTRWGSIRECHRRL